MFECFNKYPIFLEYINSKDKLLMEKAIPVILFVRQKLNYPSLKDDAFYEKSLTLDPNMFGLDDNDIDYKTLLDQLVLITIMCIQQSLSSLEKSEENDKIKQSLIQKVVSYMDENEVEINKSDKDEDNLPYIGSIIEVENDEIVTLTSPNISIIIK